MNNINIGSVSNDGMGLELGKLSDDLLVYASGVDIYLKLKRRGKFELHTTSFSNTSILMMILPQPELQ